MTAHYRGSYPTKALVIIEWGEQVLLVAVLPTSMELSSAPTDTIGVLGPGHLMIEGQVVEEVCSWNSWADFYDEMDARPPENEALPGARLALPSKEDTS